MNATVLALAMQLAAGATQMTVVDGDEVSVPVAPSGVTVQLPDFVRVVTPSGDFTVKPLAPPRPPAKAPNGAPVQQAPEAMDVRVFLVKATSGTPQEQPVTFILADSRSITMRFLPGTARDDSFVDVRWLKRSSAGGARGKAGEGFLAPERTLLLAMLHGEASFGRKLINQKVELPVYPELEVNLLWGYEAPEGLQGAVYAFTNKSAKTVIVNETVLAVGTPNRAILTQMDHEELKPCKEDDSPDPRGTGCMSLVRIVSRSPQSVVEPGTTPPERTAQMPFVLTPKEAKR